MKNALRSIVLVFLECTFLAGTIPAQTNRPSCLEYDPVIVHLAGRIQRQTFPGPPNYSSVQQGDEPDVQWILHLSNPVCVNGKRGDELNGASESNIAEIQLVIPNESDRKRYAPLVGKDVQVTGTLFHSHTAHHRTRVLLILRSAKARTGHSRN